MDDKSNEIWVFLSHSHEDYEKVRKVRDLLEDQHMRPLMFFLKCLNDHDEIDSLIKREIDCRTRFILCDSENARKSDWVKEEVRYIKSQDRIYETIDLDLPIDEIRKKLDDFKRKATLFISYNRENQYLAKTIYERLNKYDFYVYLDMMSMRSGDWYQANTISSLDKASYNGFIIALMNEKILNENSFSRHELIRALCHDKENNRKSVLPFVMENSMLSALAEDRGLMPLLDYPIQDISGTVDEDRCDVVVNYVLTTMLTPGTILTHAHNFANGINCEKDKTEAEELYSLYFCLAKTAADNKSDTACQAVGRCYEMGWGIPMDLQEALVYYRETPGCRADVERVVLKIRNEWDYEGDKPKCKEDKSLINRIYSFFTKY